MKIYVTKYALTQGIFAADALIEADDEGRWDIATVQERTYSTMYFRYKSLKGRSDFALTKEAAIATAEKMRQKAIKNLERKRTALENMKNNWKIIDESPGDI